MVLLDAAEEEILQEMIRGGDEAAQPIEEARHDTDTYLNLGGDGNEHVVIEPNETPQPSEATTEVRYQPSCEDVSLNLIIMLTCVFLLLDNYLHIDEGCQATRSDQEIRWRMDCHRSDRRGSTKTTCRSCHQIRQLLRLPGHGECTDQQAAMERQRCR